MDKVTPAKLYSLTFEQHPGYLYAYVAGKKDTLEISKQYWQEIADRLKETGHKKVLVEEDIPDAIVMSEVYELASGLARMGFAGIKIAFVDRFVEQQDINDFGILVGQNRGLFAKAFNHVSEAKDWLLSNKS